MLSQECALFVFKAAVKTGKIALLVLIRRRIKYCLGRTQSICSLTVCAVIIQAGERKEIWAGECPFPSFLSLCLHLSSFASYSTTVHDGEFFFCLRPFFSSSSLYCVRLHACVRADNDLSEHSSFFSSTLSSNTIMTQKTRFGSSSVQMLLSLFEDRNQISNCIARRSHAS